MSSFTAQLAKEILSSYPEWETFAKYETYEDSESYFVVEIPAPPEASTSLPLRISTWNDEITVDFDYYHSHFDRWKPVPEDTRHQSALLYVQSLLSEQVAVASWWQGELCKVCSQFERGDQLEAPVSVSYNRVRVRSWRGSLNEDSDAEPFSHAKG